MSGSDKTQYIFGRNERTVFTEVYFPKKAVYQGKIFDALELGHSESYVKKYLRDNIQGLLQEFAVYPALFDPHEFTRIRRRKTIPSVEEAILRINDYHSSFQGWSVYSVDGVFFSTDGTMYEEATQVVRIMFRFSSSFTTEATKEGWSDILRSVTFWLINRHGRPYHRKPWHVSEQRRFIAEYQPWPKQRLAIVKRHFTDIAKEVHQWVDDRVLFTFGYLIRQFSEHVLVKKLYEEEIWATSLFDQVLNVITRVED